MVVMCLLTIMMILSAMIVMHFLIIMMILSSECHDCHVFAPHHDDSEFMVVMRLLTIMLILSAMIVMI